jgi:hypothetical protein
MSPLQKKIIEFSRDQGSLYSFRSYCQDALFVSPLKLRMKSYNVLSSISVLLEHTSIQNFPLGVNLDNALCHLIEERSSLDEVGFFSYLSSLSTSDLTLRTSFSLLPQGLASQMLHQLHKRMSPRNISCEDQINFMIKLEQGKLYPVDSFTALLKYSSLGEFLLARVIFQFPLSSSIHKGAKSTNYTSISATIRTIIVSATLPDIRHNITELTRPLLSLSVVLDSLRRVACAPHNPNDILKDNMDSLHRDLLKVTDSSLYSLFPHTTLSNTHLLRLLLDVGEYLFTDHIKLTLDLIEGLLPGSLQCVYNYGVTNQLIHGSSIGHIDGSNDQLIPEFSCWVLSIVGFLSSTQPLYFTPCKKIFLLVFPPLTTRLSVYYQLIYFSSF